jgi:hypothetical protein
MTDEEYNSYSIEDRLVFEARASKDTSNCKLMDDAANLIEELRSEIRELEYRLESAQDDESYWRNRYYDSRDE